MSVSKTMATGALVGLGIGAVLGVWYLSKKGSKTSKQLLDKGNDLLNQVKDEAADAVKKGKDKFEDVKKQLKITDTKLLAP